MAGFFGLGNFEKEGPGVSKDAPKKKTFFLFFELFFRNFWKFLVINLFYTLISLPVVTVGLANAGLTNIARNIARDKHSFGISDFKETIKKNWKQALPVGIINTVVFALLTADLFLFNTEDLFGRIALGVAMGLLIIFIIMDFYIWTLMITFKFSLRQLYSNSFKFVMLSPKSNFLYLFIFAAIYATLIVIPLVIPGGYFIPVILIEILFGILVLPAFRFLLLQFCVFPAIKKFIIDPYYKEHPGEDIEKRRNLGLDIEEEDDEEEDESDSVFDDQINEEENE